jgi:hypothetical protein
MSRSRIYPFDSMEVGDHFVVPDFRGPNINGQSRIRQSIMACARQYQRKHNPDLRIATKLIDGNIYTYRIG